MLFNYLYLVQQLVTFVHIITPLQLHVCRWVKWTSVVLCFVHSLMSCRLVTCRSTVKGACWLLTMTIIAFYCWAMNCNYNVSSLTETLKSSSGSQHDCLTTNSQHNSTLYTAAVRSSRYVVTSSQYSVYTEWSCLSAAVCCSDQTARY